MNHQVTNAQKGQVGRWADGQMVKTLLPARLHARPPSCLPAHLPICLLLAFFAVSSASAQVASHTPAYAPQAFSATTNLQPTGKPLVRVNGAVLTDRDLLREMFTIFPYARVHNGFPSNLEAGIRDGAMKMMVFEELVYQEARRRNMAIPPADLARAQAEFRKQFHSPQEYQQFLQAECQGSEKLLRLKVERSLLIDRLLTQEVSDKSMVSAADVKAYYGQHPDHFRVPEAFEFQSITFLPPPNATPAQAQAARKRAENALRQAQATKSYDQFGLLAEKMSDDDFHVMMGDHKAADRSKLPPVVTAALAGMKPGQVSGIIEFAANDFTILRLNAHVPAGPQKFEAVRDGLLQQLTKEKAQQLRSALATRLTKTAKIQKA